MASSDRRIMRRYPAFMAKAPDLARHRRFECRGCGHTWKTVEPIEREDVEAGEDPAPAS